MNSLYIRISEAHELCAKALKYHGASDEHSESVAKSIVEAELQDKPSVGIRHLFDYLSVLREGRVDRVSEPVGNCPAPALFLLDARKDFPHTGVGHVF